MRGRENYERVRDLILSYIEAYGEVPTVRQVAQSGNVAVSTASLFLKQMEEEGYIAGRGSRGYVTVARDRMEATRSVAVCGAVSCGYRKLAVEEIEDYVDRRRLAVESVAAGLAGDMLTTNGLVRVILQLGRAVADGLSL